MTDLASSGDLKASKRITKAYEVKHAETGTPFSRTSVLSSAIDAPGKHEALAGAVDPNVFATGRVTERPDPSHFLTKHSGIGGNATSLMTEVRTRELCSRACAVARGRLWFAFPGRRGFAERTWGFPPAVAVLPSLPPPLRRRRCFLAHGLLLLAQRFAEEG
jgi:hypothetical protein